MTTWLDWLLADRTREDRPWVVAQWPNPALWLFVGLTLLNRFATPAAWTPVVSWGSRLALAWWALDELLRGVNPFRRMLGAGVLGYVLVGLGHQL